MHFIRMSKKFEGLCESDAEIDQCNSEGLGAFENWSAYTLKHRLGVSPYPKSLCLPSVSCRGGEGAILIAPMQVQGLDSSRQENIPTQYIYIYI